MASKRKQISEQLRDAILNADVSRYRIGKEVGLSEAVLSRFVNGLAGLSLDSVDKIGDYLGLEITERKQKSPKRKGR